MIYQEIFVNLPISNLKKSVEFFGGLGFKFNPQFTDEQTTCLIVNDNIFIMMSEKEKYVNFTSKPLASPDVTEMILSFSCKSPEEVRTIAEKAFSLGAKRVNDPEDIGFMFSRSEEHTSELQSH